VVFVPASAAPFPPPPPLDGGPIIDDAPLCGAEERHTVLCNCWLKYAPAPGPRVGINSAAFVFIVVITPVRALVVVVVVVVVVACVPRASLTWWSYRHLSPYVQLFSLPFL
tara:strand:- start:353 stop:685 length:333 start_codon:yes stop_codon:yes gene_type:complete